MSLRISCALALILCAGCATPTRQDAFSEVRRLSDHRIAWRTSSEADRQADLKIAALLRESLTSDSAVQIALLNNHSLQAEYEALAISQADLVQAGLLKNPIFNASARVPDVAPHGTDVEFSVTQNFFDLLLIPMRRRIAGDQLEATKLRLANRIFDFSALVKSTFVRVQAIENALPLRKQAVETTRLARETASRLHDAGNISDLDLHNYQAEYEQAELDLTAADTSAAEEREHLYELLGTSTALQLAPLSSDLPPSQPTTQPIEPDVIERRLDAQAARQNINAISRSLGLREQTQWFSQVEIGADAERQTDKQWIIGPTISVPIPLFDHGQATNAKTQAELRQARENYLALVAHIKSEVRLASLKVNNARSRAQRYRTEMVPLRAQIVEESQRQYNGNLLGPFDLLRRKQEQLDAQREEIDAIRDYWLARVELDHALAARSEPPMNADERR